MKVTTVLFAILTSAIMACSAESAESKPDSNADAAQRKSGSDAFRASAAAQEELGVVRWSRTGDTNNMVAVGYNDKDEVLVELHVEHVVDGEQTISRYELKVPSGEYVMEFAGEIKDGKLDEKMVSNTFPTDAASREAALRGLGIIKDDFDGRRSTASKGGGLTTNSLKPLVECGNGVQLVHDCWTAFLGLIPNGANVVGRCACIGVPGICGTTPECDAAREAEKRNNDLCTNSGGHGAVCYPR